MVWHFFLSRGSVPQLRLRNFHRREFVVESISTFSIIFETLIIVTTDLEGAPSPSDHNEQSPRNHLCVEHWSVDVEISVTLKRRSSSVPVSSCG